MPTEYLEQFAYLGLMLSAASLVSLLFRKHWWSYLILWGADVALAMYRTHGLQSYPHHSYTVPLFEVKLALIFFGLFLGLKFPTLGHVMAWVNFLVTAALLMP